jgi:two-component sensor histidine kinase
MDRRATIDGPAVTLPAVAAQPVAMAVHELATNAAKHGALSAETGTVAVAWRVEGRDLRIRWTERGGPPVGGAPERSGFGSRLLDGTIRTQLRGTVERTWDASGLVCDVVVPLGEAHGRPPTLPSTRNSAASDRGAHGCGDGRRQD